MDSNLRIVNNKISDLEADRKAVLASLDSRVQYMARAACFGIPTFIVCIIMGITSANGIHLSHTANQLLIGGYFISTLGSFTAHLIKNEKRREKLKELTRDINKANDEKVELEIQIAKEKANSRKNNITKQNKPHLYTPQLDNSLDNQIDDEVKLKH